MFDSATSVIWEHEIKDICIYDKLVLAILQIICYLHRWKSQKVDVNILPLLLSTISMIRNVITLYC